MPRGVLYALIGAAALVLMPYWVWLVLSIWVGQIGRRVMRPLTRLTGGRQRAASLLTALLLAIIVVPIGLIVVTLIFDAIDLAKRLLASKEVSSVFEQLVSTAPSAPPAAGEQGQGAGQAQGATPVELVVTHGMKAWNVLMIAFRVAAAAILGLFIFITGTYVVLADGPIAYRWFERHFPLDPLLTRRFAAAFTETGHGLFIGVGGSGLCQALIATTTYVIIGVPEPFVLGLLTLVASVVPAVGTAFVWAPVAVGLALTGRTDAAIAMAVIGVAVIGTIDNFIRPVLAKWGHLALPSFLIMVSMFGGMALVGASGLVLGPLVLRLAKEAMVMFREERDHDLKEKEPT